MPWHKMRTDLLFHFLKTGQILIMLWRDFIMQYNILSYEFKIDGYTFLVSMAAMERFERSIPSHSHGRDCYEIHYILSGKGTAIINNESYFLSENTLFVTGPYVLHEQMPCSPDPMIECCIYLQMLTPVTKQEIKSPVVSIFREYPFWFGQDTQNIRSLMQQIFFELEHKPPGCHTLLTALFKQLIVYMIRNYSGNRLLPQQPEHTIIHQALLLTIEESFLYDYKDITLQKLADRIHMSPRQTGRLLQQHYNSTFQRKRTEARMSAASILLKNTDNSISQIADVIGYSSSEHFSQAFKKYYGISASVYRRNNAAFTTAES